MAAPASRLVVVLRALASASLIALMLGGCTPPPIPSILGSRLPDLQDDVPTTGTASPSHTSIELPSRLSTARPLDTPVAGSSAGVKDPEPPPAERMVRIERPNEFWARLRSGFAIPDLPAATMSPYVREYAARPDFMLRVTQRGAPFLPHIAQQLELAGMPADLALLPVIESAFDARALSPAAAAGIWQFIPETGRRYGLQKTWLRDERRDPFAATSAALGYLADLYRMFGDWHLALAAYNCGEGCVARALQQAQAARAGRDFTSISAWLPAETRAYVPRFLAVRDMVLNAGAWDVVLPALPVVPNIVRVTLDRDADLATIARNAGMTTQDLAALNAGVLRQVVVNGDSPLWMPQANALKLRAAMSGPEADKTTWMRLKPARAQPQEKLSAFAARTQVNIDELRDINGIAPRLQIIQSGTLFIPLAASEKAEPLQVALLAPLKMQGEDLVVRPPAVGSARDQELLAAHPQWVESGWVPGRLQLPGKGAARGRPSTVNPAPPSSPRLMLPGRAEP